MVEIKRRMTMETNNKTPEQIAEWLRVQPWLGKFVRNCRNVGKIRKAKAMEILTGKHGEHTLRAGFIWTMSPEGRGYWNKKNEEFKSWYHGKE